MSVQKQTTTNNLSYFAIVTCRNSERTIERAVVSLLRQTIAPKYIIIIDDGSTDSTPGILQELAICNKNIHIITNPDLGYDTNRLPSNWNAAIKFAEKLDKTDCHMIATDDTIYPNTYAEQILSEMENDVSLVICSGDYGTRAVTPHGAGRFIRSSFFSMSQDFWPSGYYPLQIGCESAIIYLALIYGLRISVSTAQFDHIRPLGQDHKFKTFGTSMKSVGYHPIYVILRFLKDFITGKRTGRLGAIYMLYYYLSFRDDNIYPKEFRRQVAQIQFSMLKKKIKL